jgi:hypothetical protein
MEIIQFISNKERWVRKYIVIIWETKFTHGMRLDLTCMYTYMYLCRVHPPQNIFRVFSPPYSPKKKVYSRVLLSLCPCAVHTTYASCESLDLRLNISNYVPITSPFRVLFLRSFVLDSTLSVSLMSPARFSRCYTCANDVHCIVPYHIYMERVSVSVTGLA